jgi:hypothetical protein
VFAAVYDAAGSDALRESIAAAPCAPLLDRMYPWIADHRQRLSALGLPRVFGMPAGRRARVVPPAVRAALEV